MFTSEHLTEAFVKAHEHWSNKHGQAPNLSGGRPASFSIAFSRETGTYGAAVAREVGDRLGWPVYDRELLQRIADDIGVHPSVLESVDEREENWLTTSLAGFMSTTAANQTGYFRRLIETLLSLAGHGNCVIVGRGATNVLPVATTLRVRIVAPLSQRILAIEHEHNFSSKEAAERVEVVDRERNRFVMNHFHVDPTDPSNYDLVLNAARLSAAECADLVIAGLEQLRRRPVSNLTAPTAQLTPAMA